jgi:hypothetical protein
VWYGIGRCGFLIVISDGHRNVINDIQGDVECRCLSFAFVCKWDRQLREESHWKRTELMTKAMIAPFERLCGVSGDVGLSVGIEYERPTFLQYLNFPRSQIRLFQRLTNDVVNGLTASLFTKSVLSIWIFPALKSVYSSDCKSRRILENAIRNNQKLQSDSHFHQKKKKNIQLLQRMNLW